MMLYKIINLYKNFLEIKILKHYIFQLSVKLAGSIVYFINKLDILYFEKYLVLNNLIHQFSYYKHYLNN